MAYAFDNSNGIDLSAYETSWDLSGAASSPAADGENVVNYFFPVEIIIAGSLAPQERDIIQAQIYQDLHDAIVDRLA
jgi:hypothetical protein